MHTHAYTNYRTVVSFTLLQIMWLACNVVVAVGWLVVAVQQQHRPEILSPAPQSPPSAAKLARKLRMRRPCSTHGCYASTTRTLVSIRFMGHAC